VFMARRASNGWQDLQAEMLAPLEETEFESFCEALVRFEAWDRQLDPELKGCAGEYVPDGGRDLLLSDKKPPKYSKFDYGASHHLGPITEDPLRLVEGSGARCSLCRRHGRGRAPGTGRVSRSRDADESR